MTDGSARALVVSDLDSGRGTVALQAGTRQSLGTCDWVSGERIVCELFVFPERQSPPYGRRRTVRLVAVDHDGGNVLALFDKPPARPPRLGGRSRGLGVPYEDLEHTVVSRLPDVPDEVLVSAAREATPYRTVYRVNTRSGKSKRVVAWQQGILFWHADLDGKVRLGTGHYSFGGVADEPWIGPTAVRLDALEQWRRIDVRPLASPVGTRDMAGPRVLGYARDGSHVYYEAAVGDDDRVALWAADPATLEPLRKLKADPERDVRAMPIGGRDCGILGFSHALPTSTFTWLDSELGTVVATAIDKNDLSTVVSIPSMSDDCRRMVLASTDERTYLRFHLLDRTTGTVRHLGGHDVGRDNRSASRRLSLKFDTRDGRTLPVALTLPTTGAGPHPVVVLLGDGAGADPESLDTWPHFFATRGYAVAQPAFRGTRGYGAAVHSAGRAMRGRKLQEDIEDVLTWLSRHGHADGSRACFTGRGKGAHLALVAALGQRAADTTVLQHCAAAYAVLDVRQTKLRHDEPLDYRLCGWFPCGDWEAWAAQGRMRQHMRRAERALPEAPRADETMIRSPLVDAEHPGFPILIKTDGRATVHERGTPRFHADIEKTGFFQHVAPRGSSFEDEFLDEAAQLFDQVLHSGEGSAR